MFYSCNKLKDLDLSSFDTRNCLNFIDMFGNINHINVKINSTKANNLINYWNGTGTNVTFITP